MFMIIRFYVSYIKQKCLMIVYNFTNIIEHYPLTIKNNVFNFTPILLSYGWPSHHSSDFK